MGFLSSLFGGGSSRPQVQQVPVQSTQRSEPWGPTHSFFTEDILPRARTLSERPKQFPDFNTFTDFDPIQLEAFNRSLDVARGPTPLIDRSQEEMLRQIGGTVNPALEYFTPTARGDFLGANNALLQEALAPIYDRVDSQFAGSGRYGIGYHADAVGRGVAPAVLQNLQEERRNQLAAAGNVGNIAQTDLANRFAAAQSAPQMQAASLWAPGVLENIGAKFEGKAAEQLAHDLNKLNFLQSEEDRRLDEFLNRVGRVGGMGGTTTGISQQNLVQSPSNPLGPISSILGIGGQIANFLCDYRLKDDIEDLPDDALDKVRKLRPVSYHYRAEHGFDPRPVKGFLAHEVQEVIPEAVANEKDGQFAQLVDLNTLLSTVAKATQELAKKVERLEKKLEKFDG